MQNGYYQVVGAMVTQFHQLDVTSNNLANINTEGFKRDSLVIGDFERVYQTKRDELDLQNHTKKAAKFFNRTLNRIPTVVEESIDFSQGGIKRTDNRLDLALKQKDIFYAVDTPGGIRLTQQSSFTLDNKGRLSSSDGFLVLPKDFAKSNIKEIKIPSNGDLTISPNGDIYVDDKKIASIFVGRVKNLKELQKEGDKLYSMQNMSSSLRQMDSGDFIKQGYILTSNVNAVKEMSSLIETSRLVEMYQKVMTSQMDDLNKDAITKIATTRA